MKIEDIAKITHEINKAYCESIGDTSQTEWENAPEWQKLSAVNGVQFHLSNPDANPELSHDNWLNEKIKDGWQWGEVKNAEKKEHPCLVPYHQLPAEQKSKDYLFRQVVHSLKPYLPTDQPQIPTVGRIVHYYYSPLISEPVCAIVTRSDGYTPSLYVIPPNGAAPFHVSSAQHKISVVGMININTNKPYWDWPTIK